MKRMISTLSVLMLCLMTTACQARERRGERVDVDVNVGVGRNSPGYYGGDYRRHPGYREDGSYVNTPEKSDLNGYIRRSQRSYGPVYPSNYGSTYDPYDTGYRGSPGIYRDSRGGARINIGLGISIPLGKRDRDCRR